MKVSDVIHLQVDLVEADTPVIDENKRPAGRLRSGDVSYGVGRDESADLLSTVSAHHA